MKTQDKLIYVNIYLPHKQFVPAGVISFNDVAGHSCFSYFSNYMEQNLPPLNPSTLNYRDKNQRHFVNDPKYNNQMLDRTFWELLPNQNDWGNSVLTQKYPEYENFNNAQKLFFLGNRMVGGLNSYVQDREKEENIVGEDWLDKIRDESISFHLKQIEKISYVKAINPLSNYSGARPKCMFEDDNGDFWIAKFNLPNDPYNMAKAEQVAMEMARDMGLVCAESKVLELPSGEHVFLSKRFDINGDARFHSLSLFALAQGHEMVRNPSFPGNPSSFIQKLVRRYSDFESMDSLNIVVKMLLDIGVNNTDNHLRNLRIILNEKNKWQLSPMYDVIFNPYSQNHVYNPAGLPLSELYLANPKLAENMAKQLGINPEIIQEKIKKVLTVIENWESYCEKYDMSEEDKIQVGNAIMLGSYRQEYKQKSTKKDAPVLRSYPKLKPKDM